MSIVVLNEVLDSSRSKGTARLLMVVLAEQAHEDGVCWPGIERLARRVNTSDRNIQLLTRELEAQGELIVEVNAGRGNTNLYRVLPPATARRLIEELTAQLEKVKNSAEKVKISALLEKVKSSAEKVKDSAEKVKSSAQKVKPSSPEPLEPIEPKREPTAAGAREDAAAAAAQDQEREQAQQGSAEGADAPHGADGATATTVTDPVQAKANAGTKTATGTEKVPPAGATLAALTGALAGLKKTVPDLIEEYPDRAGWLEITPERVRELLAQARAANGNRYRGALIDALDEEVRKARTPEKPAKTNVNDLVRARLQGVRS